jgi:hypothetical protein
MAIRRSLHLILNHYWYVYIYICINVCVYVYYINASVFSRMCPVMHLCLH